MTTSPAATAVEGRDRTAALLLEAAARRFVAVGVTKTTMAEIALEAGTTKPTLYKRFPDKAAVVDALVRRETGDLTARLEAAARRHPDDAAAALVAAFATAVGWVDRHPFLRKSLALEPGLLLPYLTTAEGPVLAAFHRAMRAVVARGVAEGSLRPDADPDDVAEVWWRLALSYALTPEAGARRRTTSELSRLARSTLLEGLLL